MTPLHEIPHSQPILYQLFKGIAITSSLWNAGSTTQAVRLLPAIYPLAQSQRETAAKQWQFFYDSLSKTVPKTDLTTILTCTGLAYLEYKQNSAGLSWKLFATAAGVMPIGWLWVWLLMQPPSNKLLSVSGGKQYFSITSGDEKNPDQVDVPAVLEEFNWQMGVRALLPWFVGVLALSASLLA